MAYTAIPAASGGGGGGTVTSVSAGTNVTVTGTAAVPIINATTQFGSDTSILLPNASAANVTALEVISSLSTNTAAAEVSQWLIKLLRAGAQNNSYLLTPNGLTTDITASATWSWNMANGGVQVAGISYSAGGLLVLRGDSIAGVRFQFGASTAYGQFDSVVGLTTTGVPIQESQGAAITAASTITPATQTPNGGNVFVVTGTTTVNLIGSVNWNNGAEIVLLNTGALTYAHNQAPSGSNYPLMLAGSTNATPAVNTRITLRKINVSGTVSWWETARVVP